jgi:hypothetical protein
MNALSVHRQLAVPMVVAAPSALALVPFAPRSTLQWIDQICSTANRPMLSSATPPRALHLLAENPDPLHPAKLLAFFIADNNGGPLVIPEPQK